MKVNGNKTYMVGLGMILVSVGAYMKGNVELGDLIIGIGNALAAMCVRHGMKTGA